MRRLVRAGCPLGACLVLVLAPTAPPAAAADDATDIRNPYVRVHLYELAGKTRVCAVGTARIAGQWTFTIVGERSDGTTISSHNSYGNRTVLDVCTDVYKSGAGYGAFAVLVSYGGGTSTVGTDRPGDAEGITIWSPLTPDYHLTSGTG